MKCHQAGSYAAELVRFWEELSEVRAVSYSLEAHNLQSKRSNKGLNWLWNTLEVEIYAHTPWTSYTIIMRHNVPLWFCNRDVGVSARTFSSFRNAT